MAKKIIITTSESIENKSIEEYIDVVSAQIVLGVNVISDIKASFTDFFGGHSGAYQNKIQEMLDEAKKVLTRKAQILKADAIIGLRFDTSSVPSKSMSMLMTVVTGTAVKFKRDNKQEEIIPVDSISASLVAFEEKRMQMEDKLNKQFFLNDEDWEFLLEFPNVKYFEPLLQIFSSKVYNSVDSSSLLFKENFTKYINSLDADSIIEPIYFTIEKSNNWAPLAKLIQSCNLFSPTHVLRFVQLGFQNAVVELINADKHEYNQNDLAVMKELKSEIKAKIEAKFVKDPAKTNVILKYYNKVDIIEKLLASQ